MLGRQTELMESLEMGFLNRIGSSCALSALLWCVTVRGPRIRKRSPRWSQASQPRQGGSNYQAIPDVERRLL